MESAKNNVAQRAVFSVIRKKQRRTACCFQRYHIISYGHHISAYSIGAKYATSISKTYDMQKEETDLTPVSSYALYCQLYFFFFRPLQDNTLTIRMQQRFQIVNQLLLR